MVTNVMYRIATRYITLVNDYYAMGVLSTE